MSARVHLHLHVSDLAKSREFYEKFLGTGPVKVKEGYVKFLPEWAPVNLALSGGGAAGAGTIDHVGVQVDAVPTVVAELARVKAAGLAVREEMGVRLLPREPGQVLGPGPGRGGVGGLPPQLRPRDRGHRASHHGTAAGQERWGLLLVVRR